VKNVFVAYTLRRTEGRHRLQHSKF